MSRIINCKACGSEVSSEAASCPKCGHPISRPRNPRQVNSGCLAIILVVFGMFVYSLVHENDQAPAISAEQQTSKDESALRLEACHTAQEAVLKQLIAPASADFPGCVLGAGEYKITANPELTKFGVVGYVDSQNAFGAKLRKKFVVLLSKAPGDNPLVPEKVAVE